MRDIVTQSDRVALVAPSLGDLDALSAMWSDPETMRYIGSGAVWTRDDVAARLERAAKTHAQTGMAFWTAIEREQGAVIGQGGVVPIAFNGDEIELGYRLGREHWGRGFASEIAKLSADHAIGALGQSRLVAVAYPENRASRRVLEKIGFAELGLTDKYYGVTSVLHELVADRKHVRVGDRAR